MSSMHGSKNPFLPHTSGDCFPFPPLLFLPFHHLRFFLKVHKTAKRYFFKKLFGHEVYKLIDYIIMFNNSLRVLYMSVITISSTCQSMLININNRRYIYKTALFLRKLCEATYFIGNRLSKSKIIDKILENLY